MKRLVWPVRAALFLAGAYLSYEHCAAYWYVGPIFAVVVIGRHAARRSR